MRTEATKYPPADAARLVSELSRRPISADGLKLYDHRLCPERASNGTRLYDRDRLVRFAEARAVAYGGVQ